MTKPVTNFAASVRARLLAATQRRKGEFHFTLQRYAAERFLYRLGASPHRDQFVVKGAMLFVLWDETILRPTKDLDLAGFWANDGDSLAEAFREICAVPCPHDGLEFALETLEISSIRDAAEYHGFRFNVHVRLAGAVIPFQVDVGFGDAIVPPPIDVVYPVLLDGEAPRVRAYPPEAALAEKLHAMVSLGQANSRFKDFFDVWLLSSRFPFEGGRISAAIQATFARRKTTPLSPWPDALSPAFYTEPARSDQWIRYLKRTKLTDAPADFSAVGERVIAFLAPPFRAVADAATFQPTWPPGGPWR